MAKGELTKAPTAEEIEAALESIRDWAAGEPLANDEERAKHDDELEMVENVIARLRAALSAQEDGRGE
ncbi:hypothetical protein [Methylopila sp. 73B]|uniref:hypothetical protein n=1 Tax=Methylopila sp. 73B TaxID=1120792 RepID=UPI00039A552C|nr:hypothetical protein [Methylopila sp. 73B]